MVHHVKDPVLSLLWHRFGPWPRELLHAVDAAKKKKKRLEFFIYFWGLHLRHMEVPRLGVELELHLPAYTTATATSDPSLIYELDHGSRQQWILNPLIEVRDQTQVLMHTSRVHCS